VALPAASVPLLRRAAAPLADFAWGRRVLLAFVVSEPAEISPTHARWLATASRGASRLRPALAAAMRADLRRALVQTKAPIGLIWGARDRVVPPRVADTILALRPDALSVTIERAGHVVMAERPQQLASALLQLLEHSG
jgi:pimeloyl-ACP methyl ester carboxylesterase